MASGEPTSDSSELLSAQCGPRGAREDGPLHSVSLCGLTGDFWKPLSKDAEWQEPVNADNRVAADV